MTPEERLELLPKLLALAKSGEIPNLPTDPEGHARGSEAEALDLKELAEENFGNCSG